MRKPNFSKVNPDTIGCVECGQVNFHLNALCVNGKCFEKVADSSISGYMWTRPALVKSAFTTELHSQS